VRSAKRNQALQGKFIGSFAPYGYDISPVDKHVLVIDYNANKVVKKIFSLAYRGRSVHWISRYLHRAKLLIPRAYRDAKKDMSLEQINQKYRTPTYWSPNAIRRILMNQVYLGHTVSHKTQTKSFKNKSLVEVPKEQWIIVKDTHPRTINDETFELVQKFMSVKKRTTKHGQTGLFTGLVKCPDCGSNFAYSGAIPKQRLANLRCRLYSKNSKLCTSHMIHYDSLYQIVLDHIKDRINKMQSLGDDFISNLKKINQSNQNSKSQSVDKEFDGVVQRIQEIDMMIVRLFEQNTLGKISDERYEQMAQTYEDEQVQLKSKLKELQAEIANYEKQVADAQQYLETISKYQNVATLNRQILCELVDSIYVYHAVGKGKERTQRVEVNYRFLNQISL